MGKELRNRIWHYRKRAPKRFRHIEPRAMIYISLHTTSEALADQKIPEVEAGLFAFWEARAAGKEANAQASYDATVDLARARGYRYMPADDLRADLPELYRRIDRLMREFPDPAKLPPEIAAADLGGADRPRLMLSDLLWEYQELAEDMLTGKSADQMRRWRNPRKRVIRHAVTNSAWDSHAHQLRNFLLTALHIADVLYGKSIKLFNGLTKKIFFKKRHCFTRFYVLYLTRSPACDMVAQLSS